MPRPLVLAGSFREVHAWAKAQGIDPMTVEYPVEADARIDDTTPRPVTLLPGWDRRPAALVARVRAVASEIIDLSGQG